MLSEWNSETATPIQRVSVDSQLQLIKYIVTNGYYTEEFGNIPAMVLNKEGDGFTFTFKLFNGEEVKVSGKDAKSIAYDAVCNTLLAVFNPLLSDWFVITQTQFSRLLEGTQGVTQQEDW